MLLLAIIGYILIQLIIGSIAFRKIKTETDYLLAGRSLGVGMASFSLFATWFGAETCMGAAGAIYQFGLSGGRADPFGFGLCLFLMGAFFAKSLYKNNYVTLGDFMKERYGVIVEKMIVFLLIPSSLIWASAQVRAFGQILSSVSSLTSGEGICLATAIVLVYTLLGGLMADVITDLLQGVVLVIGLFILVYLIGNELDFSIIKSSGVLSAERLSLFSGDDATFLDKIEKWAVPICGSIFSQEIISRLFASKDMKTAVRASYLSAFIYFVVGSIPVLIGLFGPSILPNISDPEKLLPLLAENFLPTWGYIIFVGALVSAILSTVDSTLLASASLLSHNIILKSDFFKGLLNQRPREKSVVFMTRMTVAVFAVIAFLFAYHSSGIYALVELAASFGTSGVFIVAVMGLKTNLGDERDAMVALIFGIGFYLMLSLMGNSTPYIFSLLASFIGFHLRSILRLKSNI
jgi:SSS family transporter